MRVVFIFLLIAVAGGANGSLTDYLNGVKSYFGYEATANNELEGYETQIPYEVAEADQKFISQAIELTGVAISELDACQHRLILKLKSDCHQMNDIQLSKLAVGLLNCQSYIEGRKIYPCTEQMTLKACTADMDADVWNSYHLMTNRARAVCYSIRQSQFRGLTEHTVNQLMQASQKQLHTLGKISKDQEDLQNKAETTIEYISKGHQDLAEQQKDLKKAQQYGQLQIADNINKLADEKRLIIESQKQLAEMTKMLQANLAIAAEEIQKQSTETNSNHLAVLDDLKMIQEKAQTIFKKIDDSSNMLLEQSELATRQYQQTLSQLHEMNSTVTSLVVLVTGTKKALEERLAWLSEAIGGADDAIDRVYVFLWHLLFLVIGMIGSAFVNASFPTRIAIISAIPGNLALNMLKSQHAADPLMLAMFLLTFITLQSIFLYIWRFTQRRQLAIVSSSTQDVKSDSFLRGHHSRLETPPRSESRSSHRSYIATPEREVNDPLAKFDYGHSTPLSPSYRVGSLRHGSIIQNGRESPDSLLHGDEVGDRFDSFRSPSLSRSFRRTSRAPSSVGTNGTCSATTRLGTPCKNSASAGRDVCHRHLKGDSVAR